MGRAEPFGAAHRIQLLHDMDLAFHRVRSRLYLETAAREIWKNRACRECPTLPSVLPLVLPCEANPILALTGTCLSWKRHQPKCGGEATASMTLLNLTKT